MRNGLSTPGYFNSIVRRKGQLPANGEGVFSSWNERVMGKFAG
jgi:hypothetical protein